MDVETLTNHITGLSKHYFEHACRLILNDVFNLKAINIDGKNDGGSDYVTFNSQGDRINTGYQITTQKTALNVKAYGDAKKAIDKLGINKFYYFTSFNLEEVTLRVIEKKIYDEVNVPTTCLSARIIAGLLLAEGLLNKFLDESGYPLPKDAKPTIDYKEMALHSYTLMSDDAMQMKSGIYDDTIILLLFEEESLDEDELTLKTIKFLGLNDSKEHLIKKRINSLFGKSKIIREESNQISLHPDTRVDFKNRKRIYEIELASLSSAQIDLLRDEYSCDWTVEDSKQATTWIANHIISEKISNLKDAKATIVSNPLLNLENHGLVKLKDFLKKIKKIEASKIEDLVQKLFDNASSHPLISKISRASVYIALEGANPISSAKALGANRWSEFSILLEPTVSIPYICSQLYKGKVNRYFDASIKSVKQALQIGAKLYIPYFYINECAGHLLKARNYCNIGLNEEELAHSPNAFVANYYALKMQGINIPANFLDYLCTFSTSIKTERSNKKEWIRSIMTDLQSHLVHSNVEFLETPFYQGNDCKDFEIEYMFKLQQLGIDKKPNLINHDIYALQFTNEEIVNDGEHWIILTYDTSMIAVSKSDIYKGWITNPIKFLDLTENTKPLSDSQMISIIHSVATFSEKTLSAGARIIDRAVTYAAPEMQTWEFKQEIEKFKTELIQSIEFDKPNFNIEVDRKTDAFLKSHGIKLNKNLEFDIDDN
jgi:hypothetical protein